jgi:energy-coupling factor transporter ATP-binding protein EcfA2
MAVDVIELETWFRGRPKWLQDAATRVITKGELVAEDYSQLVTICVSEVIDTEISYDELPHGSLNLSDTTIPLTIESISDVTGVNALSCPKPIFFGDKALSIVYGRNGSGKSGYIRLLKYICSTRHSGPLHGNVYDPIEAPMAARISYKMDGQDFMASWTAQPIEDLCGIEIYDTNCGMAYIHDENEVSAEPNLLRFFSTLTDICTKVGELIDEKCTKLTSKLPNIPTEFGDTKVSRWYKGLNHDTTDEDIDKKCSWQKEDDQHFAELSKRLGEVNPADKARNLRRQKTNLFNLKATLCRCHEALSDEKCREFLGLKRDVSIKKKAAEEDAQKVFTNAPLEGVGSESWQLLWCAAREYSSKEAYKNQTFPVIIPGSRCVLCQSLLDEKAQQRIQSFEDFVKGELKQLADNAQNRLTKLIRSIPVVPTDEELELKLHAGGIDSTDLLETLEDFRGYLQKRHSSLLTAETLVGLMALPKVESLEVLQDNAVTYERTAVQLDKDATGQNREELKKKLRELEARKWISQQKSAIKIEIRRFLTLVILGRARDLTSTKALSRRKTVLTDELITQSYVERFQNELKYFGASNIRVEIRKSRTQIGRVYHRMMLSQVNENLKADEILSEGELRIVSLAAFLADTEGRDSKTTFIFDDPISSLDHVYEDTTAKRLVKLAEKRQVIVFTHRLSFIGFLQKYASKNDVGNKIVALSKYRPGEVTEIPIDMKRTDRAINTLLNERCARLKKAYVEDEEYYDTLAKAMCRDCRVLLERVVECDLLKEVVRRFSPEVQTKGKIMKLAQISEGDCRLIDDYMTKFSRFAHSQPDEAPISIPKPDEIQSDLQVIKEMIVRLRQR